MNNIKKFPLKSKEIIVDNMHIKFQVGRNIHGKTHSFATQHGRLDSVGLATQD